MTHAHPSHPEPAKPHRPDRRRTIALLAVFIVVAALAGWRFAARRDEQIKPLTRSTRDFVADWRCLACGDVRRDRVDSGPRVCAKCGKNESYVSIRWACHGVHRVAYQYDEKGFPARIRFEGKDWLPPYDADGNSNIKCPTCGGDMNPAELLERVTP